MLSTSGTCIWSTTPVRAAIPAKQFVTAPHSLRSAEAFQSPQAAGSSTRNRPVKAPYGFASPLKKTSPRKVV